MMCTLRQSLKLPLSRAAEPGLCFGGHGVLVNAHSKPAVCEQENRGTGEQGDRRTGEQENKETGDQGNRTGEQRNGRTGKENV